MVGLLKGWCHTGDSTSVLLLAASGSYWLGEYLLGGAWENVNSLDS